ncbi:MAG TPA: hypothetical protein VM166_13535 [Gemmatimonadaceae bacterium]|nr:hypothetical protein [Gemmatimonadaceae bacterium]
MLSKMMRYLRAIRDLQRLNMSLTRGSVGRSARCVRLSDPQTWEFTGFSQNGEDGILDVLLDKIAAPNRYFVEIGSSDGLENNTTWLSLVGRYSGLWVEADPVTASRSMELFSPLNHGLTMNQMAATPENVRSIFSDARSRTPDVMSLDIDSYDYFVGESILKHGVRPRIFVVEYNSAFGPEAQLTVPRTYTISRENAGDHLYYGASLGAWRSLFAKYGFEFVTVDRNGVNAFFVDPSAFDATFLSEIDGLAFAENYAQLVNWPKGWQAQWTLIEDRTFTEPA